MKMKEFGTLFGCAVFAVMTFAESDVPWQERITTSKRERAEWFNVWCYDADKTDRPQVLLIGDSIAWGYHNDVRDALNGRACVSVMASSACAGDPMLMLQLDPVLKCFAFDVIHVNNGLHGSDRYTPEEYVKYLRQYIVRIRELQPKAKLVWARSTAVRDAKDLARFSDRNAKIMARNEVADKLMAELDIPIDDLYMVVKEHPEYYRNDGTHFEKPGKKALAESVVKSVEPFLK